jgi:hypothetical protein
VLRFRDDDLDKDEQQRHKCGEFYEEALQSLEGGLQLSQKVMVETHIPSFPNPAGERRYAYSYEFVYVLSGRIEPRVQSNSMVGTPLSAGE